MPFDRRIRGSSEHSFLVIVDKIADDTMGKSRNGLQSQGKLAWLLASLRRNSTPKTAKTAS